MSKPDWFRRRTWSAVNKEEFFARLQRSRGPDCKAQYVRIQAFELQQTGEPALVNVAMELLEMILKEWPETWEAALVYDQLGQCLSTLGRSDDALSAYRDALKAQRKRPNVKTHAHLEFGWLCVTLPKPELYEEALKLLDEFVDNPVFPVEIYRENLIRAFIENSNGRRDQAKAAAQTAILASRQAHSGMRHHPDVGLVGIPDPKLHHRLQTLADI